MRDLMRIPDDGVPKLRFTSNCTVCIETFPSLITDIKRKEDVDTNGEDHAYDALRYLSMEIYPSGAKKLEEKKGWRERMKETKTESIGSNWAM